MASSRSPLVTPHSICSSVGTIAGISPGDGTAPYRPGLRLVDLTKGGSN
jgi:hypothetical protein